VISAVKDRLSRLGLAGRCVLLALAMLVALLIVGPIAASLGGTSSFSAAIVAATVVWVAAAAGAGSAELFELRGQSLAGVLVGMSMRMMFPLIVCLVVQLNRGKLAESGFVYCVLAFYLVMLPLDTALTLLRAQKRAAASRFL
jgi:hypothetical protein